MARPTALIRQLVIMEAFQQFVTREIARIKSEMRDKGLTIVDRKESLHDVLIQYRFGAYPDEAIYMRKMLDAETQNRAKRAGLPL